MKELSEKQKIIKQKIESAKFIEPRNLSYLSYYNFLD